MDQHVSDGAARGEAGDKGVGLFLVVKGEDVDIDAVMSNDDFSMVGVSLKNDIHIVVVLTVV